MRLQTATILIFVLISSLFISTVFARSSFDTNTIRSTTIDLYSLEDTESDTQGANIQAAIDYAKSLGSNTVIVQGFYNQEVNVPTTRLLFPNAVINPNSSGQLMQEFVEAAQDKDLRVAVVLPILSYRPADSENYTLVEPNRAEPDKGVFYGCSEEGSGCLLSPFNPKTIELLTEILESLFTEVPSLDMIVFSQDILGKEEDCSAFAIKAFSELIPGFDSESNCKTLIGADEETSLKLDHFKALQISNVVDSAVRNAREFLASLPISQPGNFLVGRYVYTSPFTDNANVQYLAQDCETIFKGVDVIFPLALPYFEKETPFGDNTNTQFDGYFKQVYDTFVRCDPTLLRIVPTLQTHKYSNRATFFEIASQDFKPLDQYTAEPAEVYHWVDYLLNKVGFVHIHILDVDVFNPKLTETIQAEDWNNVLTSNNSKCIDKPSDCNIGECFSQPLNSTASCRDDVCFPVPSNLLCELKVDLCETFPERYGCPNDICIKHPESPGCTSMFISQINNEAVVLINSALHALYPGSSSITLKWEPRLLIGVPSPFKGSFETKVYIYIDYYPLGATTSTRALVYPTSTSPQLTDLGSGEITFTIPSFLLAGFDVTFRLNTGAELSFVTTTPQNFFLSPTCFAATSFQIKDNMFIPTGSDQCQNGTTCSMLTGMCACEALWPTYTAVDFNDRCTRLSASEFITCHNGGKVGRGVDGKGIWQCDCVNGFFGKYCDSSPDCSKAMVCYNQGFVAKDPVTKQCAAQCTCQANWINNVCDTCSFRCLNGGRQNKGCSSCACAQGYSGTNCQCRQISFSMTLTSVPSAILDAYDSSSATADVFILDWFAAQLSTNVQSSATSSPITSNNLAITTMTIDTTLESKRLKVTGYVIDNCQESANNNNFVSIRDAWNTFTDYIKTNPLDIDGAPYTPVDVKTTSLDDKCDELYSNPADEPDCAPQTLVEREDGIGGDPNEENLSIVATPNCFVFITFTMAAILALFL